MTDQEIFEKNIYLDKNTLLSKNLENFDHIIPQKNNFLKIRDEKFTLYMKNML